MPLCSGIHLSSNHPYILTSAGAQVICLSHWHVSATCLLLGEAQIVVKAAVVVRFDPQAIDRHFR